MASAAQRRIKSISYAKYGYMFIAPFFLVYCFFQIWPLIQTFILSIQGNGADAGTFVGFDNYATILFGSGEGMGRRAKAMQELFLTSFKNTIILWFGNFIPQILLSLLLAVWFTDSKLHIPGVGFFKVVMYLPNIITAASVAALFMRFISNSQLSAINTLLMNAGSDPVSFEASAVWSRGIVMFIQTCPYDSCRLLAINLLSYVDKPFTKEASFNFEKFKQHVEKAMRMMDDIIDLELEKIELIINKIAADPEDEDIRRVELELWKKIRTMARKGRRTGLGITAEGDMLAALGLRYGTPEATAFAVKVQKTLALEAYRASVKMAAERGAFEIFDARKEEKNPMIGRIREADPELYAEMVKHGRRNIAMLTIAPTGTTSLMSQTTSGIEPVFRPVYKRRRKINPSDQDAKVAFVDDMGEKFEEYNVYHHNFVKWLEANGYDTSKLQDISDDELNRWVAASPYHGATANDIDWVAKVKMQGEIQKWVDHSISVTVNLPNDVSEALVADVYRTAWECGCKGVTVYRDGCREGVLIDKKKKAAKEENGQTILKRPKSIPADIVRFKNGNENWIAFVGLQDGRPYEIFTGKIEEDAMYIPPKINKGFIIKVREENGSKRYDFQYIDRYGYTNTIGGISRLFNEEFWNYAKLISGVLRHGMPITNVVSLIESLHLNSETINTWKLGVERALKQYISDGTKTKDKCPSCGQETMAYQNGCLTCMSCGYSKCG